MRNFRNVAVTPVLYKHISLLDPGNTELEYVAETTGYPFTYPTALPPVSSVNAIWCHLPTVKHTFVPAAIKSAPWLLYNFAVPSAAISNSTSLLLVLRLSPISSILSYLCCSIG